MKSELLEEVINTANKYQYDNVKLKKEMKRLIAEGQKKGDAVAIGAAYYQITRSCFYQDDIYGILISSFKAVSLLKNLNEPELYARALNALGYAYAVQDNNLLAISYHNEALKIVKKHRIKGEVRTLILNNLSNCYHVMGDYKTRERILKECVEQTKMEVSDDYSDLAMYSLNLSECYKDSEEFEKSDEVLSSMMNWIDKVDYEPLVVDYYIRYTIILYRLGNKEKGDFCIDKAFSIIQNKVYPRQIYDDLRQVLHILCERKDKEMATKILDLMREYEKKGLDTIEQIVVYRSYADYHVIYEDSKSAIEYYEKLDELNERRMKEQSENQLKLYKRMKVADREISKLQKRMKANENIISREPLTGLLNRTALLKVSSEFIEMASKKKKKIGAIFMDIDFFKECNDTYGHAKGDEIIKEVANACKCEENANVKFARYGGDEFFGIVYGLNDDDVTEIAKRVCKRIKSANIPHILNPNGKIVTVSVGVVNVPVTERIDTIIEIANFADKALYYAKNNGRNAIYLLDYNNTSKDDKNSILVKIDF